MGFFDLKLVNSKASTAFTYLVTGWNFLGGMISDNLKHIFTSCVFLVEKRTNTKLSSSSSSQLNHQRNKNHLLSSRYAQMSQSLFSIQKVVQQEINKQPHTELFLIGAVLLQYTESSTPSIPNKQPWVILKIKMFARLRSSVEAQLLRTPLEII